MLPYSPRTRRTRQYYSPRYRPVSPRDVQVSRARYLAKADGEEKEQPPLPRQVTGQAEPKIVEPSELTRLAYALSASGQSNQNELKNAYLAYVRQGEPNNVKYKHPAVGDLRIATYNVHYFTDVYEQKNTYDGVLADIAAIDADVMVLQEVILGGKVVIKPGPACQPALEVDTSDLYQRLAAMGYSKAILCNSVPSWFKSAYGNLLLIHDRIKCENVVCKKLEESIYTFPKSKEVVLVSGGHEGTQETRCFIYVKIPYGKKNLHIYATHLDVASENTRLEQVAYIVNEIRTKHTAENDVSFIIGDFNTVYLPEYNDVNIINNQFLKGDTKVINYLLESGMHDLYTNMPLRMTTWSNVRVDFIFSDKRPVDYEKNVFFTASSDHLPVIISLHSDVFEPQ